jgi:hypothetical protein
MNVKVLYGQSFFDLAVVHAGNAQAAHEIALANGQSVTDDPFQLGIVIIPEGMSSNRRVVDYFSAGRHVPATRAETPELARIFGAQMPEQFS